MKPRSGVKTHGKKRPRCVVGLTGVLGAGKTTVAQFFEKWGADVFSADQAAREALEKPGPEQERVRRLFPEAFRLPSAAARRKAIAGEVFSHPRRRKALEGILHPFVARRIGERLRRARGILVLEVPLLFETGFNRFCDFTVCVTAPAAVIRRRLGKRGFSAPEVRARMRAQFSAQRKRALADAVLENSSDLNKTKGQARKIWKKILGLAKGENKENGKR